MAKHRVIREEQVPAGQTFTFDIETKGLENLLVTWSNADTSTAAPTAVLAFPTNSKRANLPFSNVPSLPTPPLPGYNAYAGIGPNCQIALPLPDTFTVGVITPAGCICNVRVSADYIAEGDKVRS